MGRKTPVVATNYLVGATHFLTRTMPKVASEMALTVLAYNFTRVMNILGAGPLIAAMRT
jgi:hypothetical protein